VTQLLSIPVALVVDEKWTVSWDALVEHAVAGDIVGTSVSVHGTKHVVRCSVPIPDDRNPCITTVWIVEHDRPPNVVTSNADQILSRDVGPAQVHVPSAHCLADFSKLPARVYAPAHPVITPRREP